MKTEILRIERVSYQERGILQLEDFHLNIFSGEIMGLLPVNNHGLSALLHLLQHNPALRHGYVYYRGEQVTSWRNHPRHDNRIALIQSNGCLVEGLTVADNIFVLRSGFRAKVIRNSLLRIQLEPFLKRLGIRISADAYVAELGPFEKMVVDILKAVVAGCRLIVLRDIGAALCEEELGQIHGLLRMYARQGLAFLYIGFHFEELRQICDPVALMSNGRIIKVLEREAMNREALDSYTRGYFKLVGQHRPEAKAAGSPPVFACEGLCGDRMEGLSFAVAEGECVVLQDVDNQAVPELLAMLSGERRPAGGQLLVNGQALGSGVGREVAVIPELPSKTMLFPELSYLDNLCFSLDHRLPEVWRDRRVRAGIRRELAPLLGEDVFDMRVDMLTEKQKYELVYMRVAYQRPKVVFCVQPFRRADIELRMHIWELLKRLLDKKIAVVMLAVNLADCLSLADRLIRLRQGRVEEAYQRSEFQGVPMGYYAESAKDLP